MIVILPAIRLNFHINGKIIGEMEFNLESFDASRHIVPKRLVNKIRNSNFDNLEISFDVDDINIGGKVK